MAEHVLSILVKALGATQASKEIGKVDKALSGIGSSAKKGVAAAAGNLAKAGAVGIGLLGAAVTTGVEDLATLEDATTKVDGAIKTLGLTGKVTSGQVAGWANEIEANVQAAFDDKDITAATANLLRFGKVTPQNLHPAMVVMTDLAAKTGDVDSASTLLAKALADPTKAAGKLARAGVVLTKGQQDQIKAMVKAGDTAGAQALLLDALAKSTKGAAAASAGPYRDALNELKDASEDARKALAIGFLPIIEKVAGWLHKKLADPAVIAQIKGLGQSLADGFDKLLGIVGKIPWDSVADAMKIAGTASKAILDAFVSLPPWVQTAVITGWGLNKLTGGALGDIVSSLGSGLIKGVLGMTAGVVNIKAGAVTGVGGGAAAAGGGLTGRLGKAASLVGKVFLVGAAVGVFAELKGILDDQSAANKQGEVDLTKQTDAFTKSASIQDMKNSLAGIEDYTKKLQAGQGDLLTSIAYTANIDGVKDSIDAQKAALTSAISSAESKQASIQNIANERIEALGGTTKAGADAIRSRIESAKIAQVSATARAGERARDGGLAAARAINSKDFSVHVNNTISAVVNAVISNRESSRVQATFVKAFRTAGGGASAS